VTHEFTTPPRRGKSRGVRNQIQAGASGSAERPACSTGELVARCGLVQDGRLQQQGGSLSRPAPRAFATHTARAQQVTGDFFLSRWGAGLRTGCICSALPGCAARLQFLHPLSQPHLSLSFRADSRVRRAECAGPPAEGSPERRTAAAAPTGIPFDLHRSLYRAPTQTT